MKIFLLFAMAFLYVAAGTYHFINVNFYLKVVMPRWMPSKLFLVYASGAIEIMLGILLLPEITRTYSAWLIIAMLIIFLFMVHIPMSIRFYQTGNNWFVFSLARIVFQLVLIYWAWWVK
ncbi:MAG: DoxX family protein [Ignavibacteria bacterium]|nr:DoxX family protein [Ignavibacteria bacterium]